MYRRVWWSHVPPVLPAVFSHIGDAIVAASPYDPGLHGRRRQRHQRVTMMDSFRIGQGWLARMRGEIRTEFSPVVATVLALPDVLGAVIQHARLLGRKNDWSRNCA